MPTIGGVFIYELSDRLLFLIVVPCLLKAGTGIAELIALEMSKQVLISPSMCFSLSSPKHLCLLFIFFTEKSSSGRNPQEDLACRL